MYNQPQILLDLLHICEFIAMIAGVIKLSVLKNSYWIWFVYYLIFIFIHEMFMGFFKYNLSLKIGEYIAFVAIPIEYVFLFWLYAYKRFEYKYLFWGITFLFLLSLFLEQFLTNSSFTFKSLNNTFGTLIVLMLVVYEFLRQIKSDEIINFKSDKMFYINIGVILFYIGNMPFFGWYQLILKYPEIWNNYYIYFIVSNCVMYLLFAASFIWGKPK